MRITWGYSKITFKIKRNKVEKRRSVSKTVTLSDTRWFMPIWRVYARLRRPIWSDTGKCFRNLIKSNPNQIVFTIFRLIWKSKWTVSVCCSKSIKENDKYNLISVKFNKISKIFLSLPYWSSILAMRFYFAKNFLLPSKIIYFALHFYAKNPTKINWNSVWFTTGTEMFFLAITLPEVYQETGISFSVGRNTNSGAYCFECTNWICSGQMENKLLFID